MSSDKLLRVKNSLRTLPKVTLPSYIQPATDISTINLCPGCTWTHTNYIVPSKKKGTVYTKSASPRKRAGVFLYNPTENKVLVVQVYNQFTGIPKGGREKDETTQETALRELEEETGIKLEDLNLNKLNEDNKVVLDRNTTYYTIETDECLPTKLNKFDGNDVTGVGWVHPQCLCKIPGRNTTHLDKMIKRFMKKGLKETQSSETQSSETSM